MGRPANIVTFRRPASAGRRALVEDLIRQHDEALRRFVALRMGSAPEIDDLLQDVYLRLARLDDLADKVSRGAGSTRAYLYSIANNLSQGVELEGTVIVTDNLRLSGGVAYTDATIDEFTIDGLDESDTITYRDVPVLGIRPWTAKAAAIYERPIGQDMTGTVRLNWHYQDSAYTEGFVESESEVYFVPSFDTLDLSLGLSHGDRWTLTAYAENILDEDYFLSTQFEAETSRRGGFVSFIPRSYGLRFTMYFENW